MSKNLEQYIALYHSRHSAPADPPFGFRCWAEDGDHAEEQCLDANPDDEVVWVVQTDDYQAALADYWGAEQPESEPETKYIVKLKLLPEEAEVLQMLLDSDEMMNYGGFETKQVVSAIYAKLERAVQAVCPCCVCEEAREERVRVERATFLP